MEKQDWIDEVVYHVKSLSDSWTGDNAKTYAESLYDTYVKDGDEHIMNPIEAVEEDRYYWD